MARERRRRIRFPIELGVHYTVDGLNNISGSGKTVNISSNGVLLESAHGVRPNSSIEVVIEWPVPVGNVSALALHIGGKVVRSHPGLIAVRFSTHELRTRPKSQPCKIHHAKLFHPVAIACKIAAPNGATVN
jgi:hypothetical protein